MTPLDEICPDPFHDATDAARARILSRLADTELFTALTREPANDQVELQIFALADGPVALACDREERLAEFIGGTVAYLAIPGRILAANLADAGQGLLVNPGHPSQMLLDPEMLAWLVKALTAEPSLVPDETPVAIHAPSVGAVAILAEPLSQRLGDMAGMVGSAALMACDWQDGRANHTLILRAVEEMRRPAVAKAFAELLAFLPELPGGVDLAFSDAALPPSALILEPPPPEPDQPVATRDPKAPPILR